MHTAHIHLVSPTYKQQMDILLIRVCLPTFERVATSRGMYTVSFWHWVTLQGACTQSVFVLNFSFPFSCFITLTLGFKRKVHWIITNLFAFLGEGSLVGINLEYMAESSHKLIPKYGIGSAGECEPYPSTLPNGW